MKVTITGAFGFLGRELIKELEQRGHELVLLDTVDPEEATVFVPGKAERARIPVVTKWPHIKASVVEPEAVARAVQGADAVIHLAAAVTGVPDAGIATMHANVCGTYIVLDAARRAETRRFLCASSINAFGTFYWRLSNKPVEYRQMPLDESFEPVPEDPYSLSKLCNEHTCAAFTRAYGLTTAALRFAGIWGAAKYEKTVAAGLAPTKAWNMDLFHWVHVADIAKGIRQALEAPKLPDFGVYTLGAADTYCPEPTMELLRKFKPELTDRLAAPLPGRAPLLSIRRAQQAFGYAPRFRLGE
jgi:UDP-glucose 4-epimerase